MNWEYRQPVRILFGNGMIKQLPREIIRFGGKRGLLVTSPSFVKRGMAQQIVADAEGLLVEVFSGVSANPDVKECDACAEVLRAQQCDFVVALGGGSVMDCAKAAATICLTDEKITAYVGTVKAVPQAHLPIIAAPTTAGTGSEITSVSVLSDHERGVKAAFSSDGFYPALAIVDPELTYTVPPYMTACTGFDVICHAIEAYWGMHHQPLCDTLAVRALKLALTNLEKAYHSPNDAEAREKMAEASVTAGLAFALPKTSAPHACSYPLTNFYHIPHGEACILTMSHFMRYNAFNGAGERVDGLAQLVGFPNADALASELERMRQATGMRMDLRDLHLDGEQLERLVQASKHPNLLNNPVPVTEEFLRMMYRSMI